MRECDYLLRFGFDRMPVRGAIANLSRSWREVRQRNRADGLAAELLGEAVAAAALMFANVQLRGRIALQLQGGKGPVRLLLAQCSHDGELRGVLKCDERPHPRASFEELVKGSVFAINMELSGAGTPHQGIVDLRGSNLSSTLESYFSRSEQLPSRIRLRCRNGTAAGLLLQRLPGAAEDADGWNRVCLLAERLSDEELLNLTGRELLRRLFHQEDFASGRPHSLRFGCRCNRRKVAQVLRALGASELDQATDRHGSVEVRCQFCNELYRFDAVDIGQVLSGAPAGRIVRTRQ